MLEATKDYSQDQAAKEYIVRVSSVVGCRHIIYMINTPFLVTVRFVDLDQM